MSNVLEVEHLGVRFGATAIIRDLSFSVAHASTLAVIGPNGSGKSVLFRSLIGAIPHEGVIRWAAGVKLGYVPQKLDIERDLPITGRDFLHAKAAISKASEHDTAHALAEVGLGAQILALPIGAMSGGQFQRLLVAFALIGGPNVLLLDEPAAGVDEPGQEQLNEMLRRLAEDEGVTVMLISHDLSIVYRYATNVLCLGSSRPFFGPPETTLTPGTLAELYGTSVGIHIHGASHN
ncbi:MAG TPA: metal ABC transporter ATP-binding protein [Candidatus Binataceae bacterium]|nr:metal ABC transporter ATP-binding protein [Candidatus Binataceae bacterium]